MRRHLLLAASLLGALFLFGGGCPISGGGRGPCVDDPLACSDGGDFELDPSCTLEGELTVALGHGEDGFTPFADGPPTVHRGFQGGQHVFLGVRARGEALRRYDRMQVQLRAWFVGEPWLDPCGAEGPGCERYVVGDRTFVAGDPVALESVDADTVQAAGYTLILDDWTTDRPAWFEARVTDPCGREGVVVAEVAPRR